MKTAAIATEANTKTRVQLDLSASELHRLNWIMDVCELSSRKELFNNALTLLEWAVKEVADGRKIASFDDNANDRHILSMPILRSVEGHSTQYTALEKGKNVERSEREEDEHKRLMHA